MKQTTPDSEDADPEASGLLWGLLKILCTNYGIYYFLFFWLHIRQRHLNTISFFPFLGETTQQGDGPSGVTLKAILELLQGENQPWQDQAQVCLQHTLLSFDVRLTKRHTQ